MQRFVLFDLDGTLTDPQEGITNSVAYAFKKSNHPVPPKGELFKYIGPPLIEAFMEHEGFTRERAVKAVDYYREYFDVDGIFQNKPLLGATELLKRLKNEGYTLLIATSKPEGAAKRIVEHFGFAPYIDYCCGADLEGIRTAKDIVVRYAMDVAGITDANSAVMIGDRHHDVLGAGKHGIPTIGVTLGYGTREELIEAGAKYVADSFDEVYQYIKEYFNI